MYTLEDDQETSENLRKRNFINATGAPASSDALPGEDSGLSLSSPGDPGQASGAVPTRPLSFSQQITSSFKKLTTPGKNVTAASPAGKRVAVAALTVACIGVFFTALDQTVVVTALPQIIEDPGINISIAQIDHAAWIVSAYLLGFIIAMPLMGRVSDIFGRRRIFLLCMSIFGIGSIFCGLAPWLGQNVDLSFLSALGIDTSSSGLIWLVAARFFQAIGGGAVVPVAMAIVSDFYGQERRALALGIVGAVTEAGGVVGPLYGAIIVERFGWTYIFFFNAPIVFVLMLAAWFFIPKGKRLRENIDWLGAILLGLALTCLSLGLAQQGTELGPTTVNGSAPQNNPVSLALAVVFLIAFIVVECIPRWSIPRLSLSKRFPFIRAGIVKQVRWPVVDLSLFKRLPFSATSLVSLFIGAALIIAMADIPIFVNTVLARQIPADQLPLVSGLALMRMTIMIPIGAFLGGWLCSRLSCRVTGVLGLLFAATGFYLMSRWPLNVDWNQITISTVTTGFGFGLVIAPIGTTAINAVKANQAGMGSSIVTSLRMLGMTLGLAALTSWALAYFKQLASQYPSLPVTATADQFAQWSKGYADHLINAAHTVYSAVFFTTMILCLIAIIPAIFLWGSKAVAQQSQEDLAEMPTLPPLSEAPAPSDPALFSDETIATAAPVAGTFLAVADADMLDQSSLAEPPTIPPVVDDGGDDGNGNPKPRKKRRLILALACLALVLLLVAAGVFAALEWQSPGPSTASNSSPSGSTGSTSAPTATPESGPRMFQLALDDTALTSLFVSQLGLNQNTLTDMKLTPEPGDGLILSLNLHIDSSGIHRVMPIEMDTIIGIDSHQNIQLQVLHLKRDGIDAGPAAAANMQKALNQLLINSLMPSLRAQLRNVKLISIHTSKTIVCGGGAELLVLLIQAPPIQGIAAQPTPVALCFKGPVDINKLLPH
ncbi:MAG TPA: MFS transporter [Ktedonobacteraceae bacterium]|nr:MFS transporter [Ktedonobacteraceae bacterium]